MERATVGAMLPFHLRDIAGERVPPIVLASPHSGTHYPDSFLADVAPGRLALMRAEDRFVDMLVSRTAEQLDLPLLTAVFGRTYIDLNRDPTELDPLILTGAPRFKLSERVRAGLGVLPRVATPGVAIYRGPLRLEEAYRRIVEVHEPYHRQLATLLARARGANGYAVLIDCHSMPSLPPRQGQAGAAMVIGDRNGMSSDPRIGDWLQTLLERDFRTARNAPYAGGYSTEYHGNPALGTHAVQLEIDRSLYLDPASLSPNGNFTTTEASIRAALTRLLSRLRTDFSSLRQAAE